VKQRPSSGGRVRSGSIARYGLPSVALAKGGPQTAEGSFARFTFSRKILFPHWPRPSTNGNSPPS
jgi:hypothetical protein